MSFDTILMTVSLESKISHRVMMDDYKKTQYLYV